MSFSSPYSHVSYPRALRRPPHTSTEEPSVVSPPPTCSVLSGLPFSVCSGEGSISGVKRLVVSVSSLKPNMWGLLTKQKLHYSGRSFGHVEDLNLGNFHFDVLLWLIPLAVKMNFMLSVCEALSCRSGSYSNHMSHTWKWRLKDIGNLLKVTQHIGEK